MASSMKPQQCDSLVSLLRVAADGELLTEQMRCRLGECPEFEPYEVFQSLQGGWQSQRGWLSSYGLQRWLAAQPHHLSGARIEDVAAMVVPYEGQRGELRYEGFLNMVLPKDPNHTWLKEAILARGVRASWNPPTSKEGQIAPEVAYRLCQLFENEIDVGRHLKFHRKSLMDLGTLLPSICKFLDSEQGVCAGMGGLISPASVRHKLVDELGALSTTQCHALLQRINPSGACLAPFHELAKVLSLGPPWPMTTSAWMVGRTEVSEAMDTKPVDASGLGGSSPVAFSPAPRDRPWGYQDSSWLRSPSPTRVSFNVDDAMSPVKETRYDQVQLSRSASATLPTAWGALGSPRRIPSAREEKMVTPMATKESLKAKDMSPLSPARHRLSMASTQASTSEFLSPRAFSPRSPSLAGDSPFHLRGRSLAATARSLNASMYSPTSPITDPGSPRASLRSSSLPTGQSQYSSTLARLNLTPQPRPVPKTPPPPSSWCESPRALLRNTQASADRRGAAWMVLKAVAQQAELDLQVEDAKAVVPRDTPLEAIFTVLDRFGKGYITDTDLWSFGQQFGGQTSFGNLCALVHEVQIRRSRDFSVVEGRLSFRELGSFLMKAGTQEHEVMNAASTDEDARSAMYLMRNSDPCPGCGIRVQRDAECAGCPSVACTMCGTAFRCFAVLGDAPKYVAPLSVSLQYHLYRLLDTAAAAAMELENSRKQLASLQGSGDVLCTLSAVFTNIADGRLSMSVPDLRRAFASHDISISDQELTLIRNRYVKRSAMEVTFAEFVRQLSPRTSPGL